MWVALPTPELASGGGCTQTVTHVLPSPLPAQPAWASLPRQLLARRHDRGSSTELRNSNRADPSRKTQELELELLLLPHPVRLSLAHPLPVGSLHGHQRGHHDVAPTRAGSIQEVVPAGPRGCLLRAPHHQHWHSPPALCHRGTGPPAVLCRKQETVRAWHVIFCEERFVITFIKRREKAKLNFELYALLSPLLALFCPPLIRPLPFYMHVLVLRCSKPPLPIHRPTDGTLQVLYFLSSVIPTRLGFIVFHSLSLLTWGPSKWVKRDERGPAFAPFAPAVVSL